MSGQQNLFPLPGPQIKGNAVFSRGGTCRDELRRWWVEKPDMRWASWLMLNPSNAGAEKNDPTVCRVINFSRNWGCDGAIIVNLYPFITSSPAEMWKRANWENNGPDWYARDDLFANAKYIEAAGRTAALRVVAFGTQPIEHDQMWLEECLEAYGQPADIEGGDENFYCLGFSKNGQPLHPMARGRMRVPDSQTPLLWRPA